MLKKIANIFINIVPTKILNLRIFKIFFLNESIFNLFFSKQYYAVNENYEKNKNLRKFNNDENHLIFASKIIINQNISEISKKLKLPLKKKEIIKTFKEDLVKEKKNKRSGILTQPKYVNKSMLAAMIGFKFKKNILLKPEHLLDNLLIISKICLKKFTHVKLQKIFIELQKNFFT